MSDRASALSAGLLNIVRSLVHADGDPLGVLRRRRARPDWRAYAVSRAYCKWPMRRAGARCCVPSRTDARCSCSPNSARLLLSCNARPEAVAIGLRECIE